MGYTLERSAKVVEAFLDGDKERAMELHREMPECDLDGCEKKAGLNYTSGDYCSGFHHHLDTH